MTINRTFKPGTPKKKRSSPLGLAMAKRIKACRKARGFSQTQVEKLAGVSFGSMSRFESGERTLLTSVEYVLAICKVLDVDVGWAITGIIPDGNWRPPLGVIPQVTPKTSPRAEP